MFIRHFWFALFLVGIALGAYRPAVADDLDIDPVIQQTPVWCWAATSEMILKYYGFPNLNPGGNYQCGVVGSVGGVCSANCAACITTGGTSYSIANIIRNYASVAYRFTGYRSYERFSPRATGRLSVGGIIDHIDAGAPVLAGITPSGFRFPSGSGMSQHAVVIVGYEETDDGSIVLTINDPFPYPAFSDPYRAAGGDGDGYGQHWIDYGAFVSRLGYDNSIVFR